MQITRARINALSQISSKFYSDEKFRSAEMGRIDASIAAIRDDVTLNSERVLDLQSKWSEFKARVLVALEADKAIKEGQEESEILKSLLTRASDINSIWAKLKGGGLKDFVAEILQPVQQAMGALKRPKIKVPPPLPPPLTEDQLAAAASLESREVDRQNYINQLIDILPKSQPRLSKTIGSLAQHIADGTYGKRLKEAFKDSNPSVALGVPLLKILLLESCSQSFSGQFNAIEWELSKGFEAQRIQLQEFLRTVSLEDMPALLEEVFLEDTPLSENGLFLSQLLTDMIKYTSVSSYEERAYIKMLLDRIEAYDSYEMVFEDLPAASTFLKADEALMGRIAAFGSVSPRQFLKAVELSITYSAMAKEEGELLEEDYDLLVNNIGLCIDEALRENDIDDLIENYSDEEFRFLSEYLKDALPGFQESIKDPLLMKKVTLWLPSALTLYPDKLSNVEYVYDMLRLAQDPQANFRIPTPVFYAVMKYNPNVALDLVPYVQFQDRAVCAHSLKEVLPERLEELNVTCRVYAQEYIKRHLYSYLENPTSTSAEKVKIKIVHLLDHLKLNEEDEYQFLSQIILVDDVNEEAAKTAAKKLLAIVLIPEFIRIGKKKVVREIVKVSMEIIQGNSESYFIALFSKDLTSALLKASGFTLEGPDTVTLGPLMPLESDVLDPEIIALFKEAIGGYPITQLQIKEWIRLSKEIYPFSESLSLTLAEKALSDLREYNRSRPTGTPEENIDGYRFILDRLGELLGLPGSPKQEDVKTFIRRMKLIEIERKKAASRRSRNDQEIMDSSIGIFSDYADVGNIEDGLMYAEKVLNLNPLYQNRTTGPLAGLLKVAHRAFKVLSTPGQEAFKGQVESLILKICEKVLDPTDQLQLQLDYFPQFDLSSNDAVARIELLLQRIETIIDPISKLVKLTQFIARLREQISPQVIERAKKALSDTVDAVVSQGPQNPEVFWRIAIACDLIDKPGLQLSCVIQAFDFIENNPERSLELQQPLLQFISNLTWYLKAHSKEGKDPEMDRPFMEQLFRAKQLVADPLLRLKQLFNFRGKLEFENMLSLEFTGKALASAFALMMDPRFATNKYFKRGMFSDLVAEIRLVNSKLPEQMMGAMNENSSLLKQVTQAMDENEFDLQLEGVFFRQELAERKMEWCIELTRNASEGRVAKVLSAITVTHLLTFMTPERSEQLLTELLAQVRRFPEHKATVLAWIRMWNPNQQDDEGTEPFKAKT